MLTKVKISQAIIIRAVFLSIQKPQIIVKTSLKLHMDTVINWVYANFNFNIRLKPRHSRLASNNKHVDHNHTEKSCVTRENQDQKDPTVLKDS